MMFSIGLIIRPGLTPKVIYNYSLVNMWATACPSSLSSKVRAPAAVGGALAIVPVSTTAGGPPPWGGAFLEVGVRIH